MCCFGLVLFQCYGKINSLKAQLLLDCLNCLNCLFWGYAHEFLWKCAANCISQFKLLILHGSDSVSNFIRLGLLSNLSMCALGLKNKRLPCFGRIGYDLIGLQPFLLVSLEANFSPSLQF